MDVGLYKEKTTEIVVNPMIHFLEEWGGEEYGGKLSCVSNIYFL